VPNPLLLSGAYGHSSALADQRLQSIGKVDLYVDVDLLLTGNMPTLREDSTVFS